jgi:ferric-dicitrate binding protein FerR (iron transport regulator)
MERLDEALIIKYIEGKCSEPEVKRIFRWLNEAEDNRQELFELKRLAALKQHATYTSPEHIERSLREMEKLHYFNDRMRKERRRKLIRHTMQYAAVFILLFAVSWVASCYVTGWTHPAEMIVVEVADDKPFHKIRLNDSTQVWLAKNSRIEYPERFSKSQRRVFLKGQAYFDVAKDEKNPFFVETADLTVKVKGTSFEVNTVEREGLTDVILESGSVDILNKNEDVICALTPGQHLEYRSATGTYALHRIDTKAHTSWRGGVLEFDGLSFAEIAKILERYYYVRIVLDKSIDNEQRFVGSLSYEKTIKEMLKTMEYVTSVEYHVNIDTVVHIRPKKKERQ